MSRTLAGYAFASSPEGVATELAARLASGVCLDCQPYLRDKWRDLAKAFFVAAGRKASGSRVNTEMRVRVGQAVDVFTHGRLPTSEVTGTLRRPRKRT